MNLISCTHNCIYQLDGMCNLIRVSSVVHTSYNCECAYYTPMSSNINKTECDKTHIENKFL